MYSYARIKKIKNDLHVLVLELKSNKRYSSNNVLSSLCKGLELELPEYDAALMKVGVGGYCRDEKINAGFEVAEQLILKIRDEIRKLESDQ